MLSAECASRNATIDELVAELSGGPAAAPLGDDDDDDASDDDDGDAGEEEEPKIAAQAALASTLAELGDERQRTAEWVQTLRI